MRAHLVSIWISSMGLLLSATGYADCVDSDPIALAKAAWQLGDGLLDQPNWQQQHVAMPLRQLLAKERQCSQGEVCAIDAGIWTAAQDGEPYPPYQFRLVTVGSQKAVKIRYQFGFGAEDRHKKPRSSTVMLISPRVGCWQIGDIVAADKYSLLKQLQGYYKTQ